MSGGGCQACNFTGYFGRMALFEMLTLDEETRRIILNESTSNVLRDHARKNGMRLLREEGITRIVGGQTTVEEIVRTTL